MGCFVEYISNYIISFFRRKHVAQNNPKKQYFDIVKQKGGIEGYKEQRNREVEPTFNPQNPFFQASSFSISAWNFSVPGRVQEVRHFILQRTILLRQ